MSHPDFAPAEALLIAGCGLIGSSIARGARARGLAQRIFVLDPDPGVVSRVQSLGLADAAATGPSGLPGRADLVALAAPPAALGAAAALAAPALAPGAIMFDTGSIKSTTIKLVAPIAREAGAAFVPAHPIAGTESSGPEAGFATLFDGRWCVLTPEPGAPASVVAQVASFWRGLGAQIAEMSAAEHDALFAATSHLPHLVAYALTATATDEGGGPRPDFVRFAAGGFRDFTRIAASDPVMWRDVFLGNRGGVLAALDRFEAEIAALRAAVEAGDGAALFDRFVATRAVRAAIVAAGQETAAPNFGRPEPRETTNQ